MQVTFAILEWSAYAHGLSRSADWLAWAEGPLRLPVAPVTDIPALPDMPAMMRRRVDRLGRLACQVAYWCQVPTEQSAMVFASRYGDAAKSLSLLGDLVRGEPLSPAGFGLSVHNAVSALYSIACGHVGNTVVVAAGRATVAAALTEAAALLADGAPDVLVVYYEAPLPDDYASFHDEDVSEYAWAWRVALPGPQHGDAVPVCSVDLTLGASMAAAAADTETWPTGLALLRHVLRQIAAPGALPSASLVRDDRAGARWSWSAHA